MSDVVEVWDRRPEIRNHKCIHQESRVPEDWSNRDVIVRMGVAEHLVVYRYRGGLSAPREEIQHGRQ